MPEISVIVCTYNRDQYIQSTLKCLENQTINPDKYEVIIVDNNSTDTTSSICKKFIGGSNSKNFIYYLEKEQGHTYARNRGIKKANGNILAFIDDDAFVKKDYISGIKNSFENHPEAVAIGGKIIPIYEAGQKPKWMSKFLLPLVAALDMGDKVKPFKKNKFPIGANMVFRKEVFSEYGLFDIRLGRRGSDGLEGGDEKDLFNRLNQNNRVILYDPEVKVDHIIPEKRVQISYVRGLAIGVGTSERKRLQGANSKVILQKWFSELTKVIGTLVLYLYYSLSFQFEAATMLVRFRFWVLKGLLIPR